MGLNDRWASTKLVRYGLPLIFFLFICWIIFDADTGDHNLFIEIVKGVPLGDKWGHLLLYGVLGFLLNLGFRLRRIRMGSWRLFIGTLIVGVFAILEEFTQLAFATRSFDLLDIVADLIGLGLFSWICSSLQKNKPAIKFWIISLVNDLIPDEDR